MPQGPKAVSGSRINDPEKPFDPPPDVPYRCLIHKHISSGFAMSSVFSSSRTLSFANWLHQEGPELGSSLEINADSSLAYRVLFHLLKSREDIVWILPTGMSFARFVQLIRQTGADMSSQLFFAAQDAGQVLLGLQQAIQGNTGTIVLELSESYNGELYQLLGAMRRISQKGIRVIVIRPLEQMRSPTAMQSRLAIIPQKGWLSDRYLFVTLKDQGVPVLRKKTVGALPAYEPKAKPARAFFSIAEREALLAQAAP